MSGRSPNRPLTDDRRTITMPTESFSDGCKFVRDDNGTVSRIGPAVRTRTASESRSGVTYETVLWADGGASCNCRGWATYKSCRHVKFILAHFDARRRPISVTITGSQMLSRGDAVLGRAPITAIAAAINNRLAQREPESPRTRRRRDVPPPALSSPPPERRPERKIILDP